MGKIKTPEQINGIRKACRYVSDIFDCIKYDILTFKTTKHIEDYIIYKVTKRMEKSGVTIESASKRYKGFPGYCCVSVNDELCHGIPSENKTIKENDLVKVDIALKVDGYYGDACRSYRIGYEIKDLEYVVEMACKLACRSVRPGKCLGDIGFLIQTIVRSCGFDVCRDMAGHGIGLDCLHDEPTVYHWGERNKGERLEAGQIITIEPIICENKADYIIDVDRWTARTKDGGWAAQHEETVLVTETGYEILTG